MQFSKIFAIATFAAMASAAALPVAEPAPIAEAAPEPEPGLFSALLRIGKSAYKCSNGDWPCDNN
ncbi:hypothetical protein N7490_001212 [Penicillium lividum]|nr:hypothetical protein N7490_001212 [Penicillium lividum]